MAGDRRVPVAGCFRGLEHRAAQVPRRPTAVSWPATYFSAHIRSLAGTHLLDVPSSDQHTVKPWFNGKLDFAPVVKEPEGFPLLGGRLEYFDGRPAAALIYGRAKHTINLFTWPSAPTAVKSPQTLNGYHLTSWSGGDMMFWAVSDLNEADLRQFVSLYRQN